MAETKTKVPRIEITIEQLQKAVQDYDTILPSEIAAVYQQMLTVPPAGLKIAQALQQAMLDAKRGILSPDRVLDAAVLPAFLIGLLVGIGQQEKPRIIS